MRTRFGHEKLEVYQRALKFVAWVTELCASLDKKYNAVNHLEQASESIALNIAEGNGIFT